MTVAVAPNIACASGSGFEPLTVCGLVFSSCQTEEGREHDSEKRMTLFYAETAEKTAEKTA